MKSDAHIYLLLETIQSLVKSKTYIFKWTFLCLFVYYFVCLYLQALIEGNNITKSLRLDNGALIQ